MIKTLILILLLAVGYFALTKIYLSPCDNPIHYKVGVVDKRFNVSLDKFQKDIEEAANIWENKENKNLFVYDPEGKLTINLIFDSRQALNNQINNLKSGLDDEKNSITPDEAKYKQMLADYNQKLNDLKTEIDYWNSKGGAPSDVYNKILEEQKDLQTQADELNKLGKTLNQKAQTYNSGVVKLNNTINNFNNELTIKPEEGLYDSQNQNIDIYFNINQNELIHTLAHEMGHALGLPHNSNTNSIMYPQTSNILIPTKDDLSDLNLVCEEKSLLDIVKERVGQPSFPSSPNHE